MSPRTMPPQKPGQSEQSVGTPLEFLTAAERKLGIKEFVFDLAADPENAICPDYYDEADNSLDPGVSWKYDGWSFLNPPYAKIGPWVEKACDEASNGADVAVLVPAAVGSNWWKKYVHKQARVLMLNGRITFVGHNAGYPKDLALLLYGPNELPGYETWSWQNDLTPEEKDMAKRRIGKGSTKKFKAVTKAGKKAEKIAAARASKVTNIASGKQRGRPKKAEEIPASERGIGRVTTFKPNASTSMEAAPEPKALELGAIQLPNPDEAVRLLGELAALNDQALKAQHRYNYLKEHTKNAKDKYDGLAEQVLTRLRQSTHASDLPLFADVDKREQDQAVMESGPEPIAGEPAGPPESDPEPEGVEAPSDVPDAPEPASEPETGLADEQIPF